MLTALAGAQLDGVTVAINSAQVLRATFRYAAFLLAFRLIIEVPLTLGPLWRSVRRTGLLVPSLVLVKMVSFLMTFLPGPALDPGVKALIIVVVDSVLIAAGYRFIFRSETATHPRSVRFVAILVVIVDLFSSLAGSIAQLTLFSLYIRLFGTVP